MKKACEIVENTTIVATQAHKWAGRESKGFADLMDPLHSNGTPCSQIITVTVHFDGKRLLPQPKVIIDVCAESNFRYIITILLNESIPRSLIKKKVFPVLILYILNKSNNFNTYIGLKHNKKKLSRS